MADREGQREGQQRRRRRRRSYSYPISNFYPRYKDGSGRVDRIEPISTVQMQRVLPRYDFSTAQTRTSGLGPPLIDSPVSVEITGEGESPIMRMDRDRMEPPPEHRPAHEGDKPDTPPDEEHAAGDGLQAGQGRPAGDTHAESREDEAAGEQDTKHDTEREFHDESRGRIIDVEV